MTAIAAQCSAKGATTYEASKKIGGAATRMVLNVITGWQELDPTRVSSLGSPIELHNPYSLDTSVYTIQINFNLDDHVDTQIEMGVPSSVFSSDSKDFEDLAVLVGAGELFDAADEIDNPSFLASDLFLRSTTHEMYPKPVLRVCS